MRGILTEQYDAYQVAQVYWLGSASKLERMELGKPSFTLEHDDTFKKLIDTLGGLFKQHYASLNETGIKQYSVSRVSTSIRRAISTAPADPSPS